MKDNIFYLLNFKGSLIGELFSGTSKILYADCKGKEEVLALSWSMTHGRGKEEGQISNSSDFSRDFADFGDFEEESPVINFGTRPTIITYRGREIAERFIYPRKKKETVISRFLPPIIKRDPLSYKGTLYDSWLRLIPGKGSEGNIHEIVAFAMKCQISQSHRFIALD
jgi:hypothetical protein